MTAPRHTAALILLPSLLLAASIAASAAGAAPLRGEALAERWCTGCHGVKPGQESPNPKAPAFPAIANEPSATAYALHVFLQTTHPTMPNFVIEGADIDDLIGYILSLKTKP